MKRIDTLILCGGLGKRLRSVVKVKSKSMADIAGRPFLDILVDYLATFGLQRFVFCTGYKAGSVEEYFQKRNSDLEFVFSKENKPLGTAGAVKNAQDLIKSSLFLVLNGDCFCSLDFNKFIAFHKRKKALLSMVLARTEDRTVDYGGVILGKSAVVSGFSEKKASDWLSAGIYLFERKIFSYFPSKKNISFEYDLFPKMIGKGFYGYKSKASFVDIGVPKRYKEAIAVLSSRSSYEQ